MKISEHFIRSGSFFFRYRSYLPLFTLPVIVASFLGYKYPKGSHTLDLFWELGCFLLSLLGLGIRIFVSGTVPKGTSGRNTRKQRAEILNTTGAYSVIRHPLYLGNYLMVLGASFVSRHWFLPLLLSLGFILYYERIIFTEEEFLEKKFGEEFRIWARNTPIIIPRFKNYRPPDLPFSWKIALRKEYHTVFAITGTFFGLELLGDFFIYKEIKLDPVWTSIFIAGFLFYLAIRIMKTKTNLLKVEGR